MPSLSASISQPPADRISAGISQPKSTHALIDQLGMRLRMIEDKRYDTAEHIRLLTSLFPGTANVTRAKSLAAEYQTKYEAVFSEFKAAVDSLPDDDPEKTEKLALIAREEGPTAGASEPTATAPEVTAAPSGATATATAPGSTAAPSDSTAAPSDCTDTTSDCDWYEVSAQDYR